MGLKRTLATSATRAVKGTFEDAGVMSAFVVVRPERAIQDMNPPVRTDYLTFGEYPMGLI
jgi:hypothetical protein